jgi:hypothetical protein
MYLHSILISDLDRGQWLASRFGLFAPENEPGYPLKKRLGSLQNLSGRFGEERRLFLTGIQTPDHLVNSLISIRTTITRSVRTEPVV